MEDVECRLKKICSTLPHGVTLVAVSKFHPIDALQKAYDSGQRIFGESRAQELSMKHKLMPDDVQWHFIGHLQTNKVRAILPYVSLIHSVDSLKLLSAINQESERIDKITNVLLQLHVAQEETKYGFTIEECVECAKSGELDRLKNVRVCGLMGMATNTDDENEIKKEFNSIKAAFDLLKQKYFDRADYFTIVSMGMSDDYRIAIEEGSNMVRVGSSIFGVREY